jgi:Ca-activated chloride channel family protein
MDMSLSMRATDVNPNRLTRANFKAIDLIKEINDGEVGLVAYAGDAFTISPLTQDIANLENLIPSLSPEIMPSAGSNPVAGLKQAISLLDNAGYQHGHIYWITDGINSSDISPVRALISQSKYEFSVLTIGTEAGAPVQLTDGTLLKQNNGSIVIPQLNTNYLRQALNVSNARQNAMSMDDSDIKSMLLTSNRLDQVRKDSTQESTGDAWRDMGAYAVLLILPIAAMLFRRGVLFSIALMFIFTMPTANQAMAQSHSNSSELGQIEVSTPPAHNKFEQVRTNIASLFLNDNQKGEKAFNQGDYQSAKEMFNNINWRAASAYKAGDYESALELYQQSDGLSSIYNQGNALAKLGQLQKAIEAYEKVLNVDPEHEQAAANKALLEQLLDQQEQQEQQEQENQQDQQQDSEQDQQQSDSDNRQQGQDGEPSEQQQQQSDASEQGSNEQESSESEPPEGEQAPSEAEQNQQQNEESEQEGNEPPSSPSANEQEQEAQNQASKQPVQAVRQDELSPEEREQMRRLQTLMNKVPDDPAFLLQRKMLIEAQKRKQFSPPTNQEQEW